MVRKTEYLCVFLSGGIIYNLIELAWRGYSHWSMTVAGGICLLLIHMINQKLHDKSLLLRYLTGCVIITVVEFVAGIIVNVVFKLYVWDYSAIPGNIMGQICPLFSFFWFLITILACLVSDASRRFFNFLINREENAADG